MKKRFLLLLIVASVIVANPVLAQVSPGGIVSYWKFNDGTGTIASDAVGANPGTVNGATWTPGIVDGALKFDGVDDEVDAAEISGYADFSMAVWFKTNDSSHKGGCVFNTALGSIYVFSGVNNEADISPDIRFAVYRNRDGRGINQYAYFKRFVDVISTNEWHFAVLTADGSNSQLRAYLDGEFLGDLEWNHMGLSAVHSYTTIGADRWMWAGSLTKNWFFRGVIDEVAVYDHVLSAEEIWQLYQNGLNGHGYDYVPALQASVDINPATLNLKSKAKWVTAYIELPDGYDVADIDVSTVMLDAMIPAEDRPTEVGDYDNNGISDLMVKFDRQTLIEYLDGTTGETALMVGGNLNDGTLFEGNASIIVINPGKR